jgi:hypothetical protein
MELLVAIGVLIEETACLTAQARATTAQPLMTRWSGLYAIAEMLANDSTGRSGGDPGRQTVAETPAPLLGLEWFAFAWLMTSFGRQLTARPSSCSGTVAQVRNCNGLGIASPRTAGLGRLQPVALSAQLTIHGSSRTAFRQRLGGGTPPPSPGISPDNLTVYARILGA